MIFRPFVKTLIRFLLCCVALSCTFANMRAQSPLKVLIASADSLQDVVGDAPGAIALFNRAEQLCLDTQGLYSEDMKYILGCTATCAQIVGDYDLYISSLIKLDHVCAKIGYFDEVPEDFICFEVAKGLLTGQVDDEAMTDAEQFIKRGQSKSSNPEMMPRWDGLAHKINYLRASTLPNLEEAAPILETEYNYFLNVCPLPRDEIADELLGSANCWSSNLMNRRTDSHESLKILENVKSVLLKAIPDFNSLELDVNLMYALANIGEDQRCIDLGNQILAATPEDEASFTFTAAVKYNLGRSYNSLGRHQEALDILQTIYSSPFSSQLDAKDTNILNVEVALALAGLGRNMEAENLALEILKNNPLDESMAAVYWLLGILANENDSTIELSLIEDVIAAYDRMEFKDPGYATAFVEYAKKFAANQMNETAMKILNKAIEMFKQQNADNSLDYYNALLLKATLAARFDDYETYAKCLQNVIGNSDNLSHLFAGSDNYEASTAFLESIAFSLYSGLAVSAYEFQKAIATENISDQEKDAAMTMLRSNKAQLLQLTEYLNDDVINWLRENNPDRLATLYHNYALILRDLNEYDEGLSYIDSVLPSIPKTCQMYSVLDELREYIALRKDGPQHHVDFIQDRFNSDKQSLKSLLNGLASKRRSEMWQQFYGNINNYVEFALLARDDERLNRIAFDAILLSKGLLLQSELDFSSRILKSNDDALIKKYQQWIDLSKLNPQEADRLERDIVRSLDLDFESDLFKCSWSDVKKSLRPAEYALEFRAIDDYGVQRYMAFLIGPGFDAPKVIEICNSTDLFGVGQGDSFDYSGLSRLVWSKLSDFIPASSTVFFSPDMQLHSFPLENLPDFESPERLISQRWDLRRVSSTRQLTQAPASGADKNIEIYGGLDYFVDASELLADFNDNSSHYRAVNLESEDLRSTISSIRQLPGSEREVRQIADLLSSSHIPFSEYSGAKGTEARFKAFAGKEGNVLHLTTHGFFVDPSKNSGRISNILGLCGDFNSYEDALLRSGLMMAGVNETILGRITSDRCEDGLLTAKEISALNLENIDLAILSACETGVGAISGEGVFGLQRGFKLAGAKSIMMTLWKVEDNATEQLMVEFYKNWLKSNNARSALAQAQATVRATPGRDNPKYWAGFILLDSMN